MTSDRHRVAVTGVGLITPVGRGAKEFWHALCTAAPSVGPIAGFDPSWLPVRFAAQVGGFDAVEHFTAREAKRLDRATRLGAAAAAAALADAGPIDAAPERWGVVAGTGHGGVSSFEEAFEAAPGPDGGVRPRPGPLHVPMVMANATAAVVSMRHRVRGPSLAISTACASGAHALGEGARLIREGAADVVLAGGTEAAITPVTVAAFCRLGALSERGDDPVRASRPFDAHRDGFVMGEGAGFVLLERLDHAVERGARRYGEVLGYGRSSDGYHLTAPDPSGAGARVCVEQALADAGLDAADIAHVNAHATSTRRGDLAEARVLGEVFGPGRVPVTAPKGVTGHLLGASGAVEAVAALLSLRDGIAPPIANLDRPDPAVELDLVRGAPRPIRGGPVLSNSFGFGGHNAALVFGAVRA
ncbi:beta-ketoacyl-[acyl-carrier-protein] synthase family protein [Allonocardiopsis opalescens]|uniref:3-oxoacyl-[acyl-carrier-protein] synthase II n=1 Tax=Allonocardiopsis opalescens TaxID=1144618 RepID=A0A2T0QCI2_9ACTN|nr:beta-ketoacyl-[acyl-carrier-protein] synthase family protein [Allonocardiopsis opalescens]PRY01627.1 3-oxoacyl-[acyl-carrier-protein] synthase II [Allonocardiopsis opalescens]